jgi:antitoxin ParD1/3/4
LNGGIMANAAEIQVALTSPAADAVRDAVKTGEYASYDEVVRAALLEWRLRRTLSPGEHETICRLWDAGIASGAGRFGSIEEIKREARGRWEAERASPAG